MKIGVIGTGPIGKAFARHAAEAGYDVLISNSRGPETLVDTVNEIGHGIRAVTATEAALADVIFFGMNFRQVPEAVASLPSLKNKIVIDPSNAILFPEFKPMDLGDKTSSEIIAAHVPGAKVVKAFNTLLAAVLEGDPKVVGGSRVIVLSGDDKEAKSVVKEIIKRMGFSSIDLGSLKEGGRIQQFGGPFSGANLVRLPD